MQITFDKQSLLAGGNARGSVLRIVLSFIWIHIEMTRSKQ